MHVHILIYGMLIQVLRLYVHQLKDISLAVAYCDRIYTAYTHSISHGNSTSTTSRAEIDHTQNNRSSNNNSKLAENKLLVQKVYLTLFKVRNQHVIYAHL